MLNKKALTHFSLDGLINLVDDPNIPGQGKLRNARGIDKLFETIKPTIKNREGSWIYTVPNGVSDPF